MCCSPGMGSSNPYTIAKKNGNAGRDAVVAVVGLRKGKMMAEMCAAAMAANAANVALGKKAAASAAAKTGAFVSILTCAAIEVGRHSSSRAAQQTENPPA